MESVLEIAIQGDRILRVNGEDYSVLFPLPVVFELEKALGRSMRQATDFLRMQAEEVPAILEHGLRARQAERSAAIARLVMEAVGTESESVNNIMNFLCVAAYPKTMEKVEARIKQLAAKGREPKNAPSADAF
jgi:hypothetical protein